LPAPLREGVLKQRSNGFDVHEGRIIAPHGDIDVSRLSR
jgi:hypothetical protein